MNFANSLFVVLLHWFGTTKVQKQFRMKKSEIIATVLSAVSEETEITLKVILSQDRRREVVDARHIGINLLYKCGIYQSAIAEIFRITPRNIQYILSDFDARMLCSPPMRNDYERIRKRLGNTCEIARK